MTEARSRLCEIIGISGIDESDDTQNLKKDLQKTSWDNERAIDKDNKP
ncbi:hypothetical protein BOH78_4083 [Pichia kudriavzevii]|uniref:Uncharacterized protein n=1 Tax=Pichia kudriavzevii TaxID=4909 RepID=A0A1V2LHW0_PICKU|nr:hypothetical protein BOH78_4083 [Pichia kudriavzevii]